MDRLALDAVCGALGTNEVSTLRRDRELGMRLDQVEQRLADYENFQFEEAERKEQERQRRLEAEEDRQHQIELQAQQAMLAAAEKAEAAKKKAVKMAEVEEALQQFKPPSRSRFKLNRNVRPAAW